MNFACLSVCMDPINVKTSEPIKLNIFEATHVILNIYGYSELPKY